MYAFCVLPDFAKPCPSGTMSESPMSRRSNKRNLANIAIQSLLGVVFFAIWVLVGVWLNGEDLVRVVAGALPYIIMFEFGVLSRYVPGVKSVAKRLE